MSQDITLPTQITSVPEEGTRNANVYKARSSETGRRPHGAARKWDEWTRERKS
jgi:hypothetical protein